MVPVVMFTRKSADHVVGDIPIFLNEDDGRCAREQFNERYAHGGGWRPMRGWAMYENFYIQYEDESPLEPWAMMRLHNETILVYDHSWVAIIQPDQAFEVSRMD